MIRIHSGQAQAEVSLPHKLPACMGGWCKMREACTRYHANTAGEPVERLCEPGQDGVIDGYPIRLVRAAGTWELGHAPQLRAAQPFDALMGRG